MTKKRQILIQNALTLLCEAQRQAVNLKEDTQEEIRDMMHKISALTKDGVAQLLQSWHDNKEHLPGKLVGEVDKILDKVGLVRKTKAGKSTAKKTKSSKAASPKKKKAAARKKMQTES